MVDEIESLILCDQYALVIFLDIRDAFDNLNVDSGIQGMCAKCLPPHLVRWYAYYLCWQSVTVKIKGISITRSLTWGTPQGGHPVSLGVEPGI